ncbi:MAG: CinA family protein [Nocardioides sp.]
MDAPDLAARLHATLLERGLTVASAESLTGGGLGALLSGTPGASTTYRGGVVCYATELKQRLLGVTDEVVAGPGVVSAECAAQMATGARTLLGCDLAVSTTGVAGPDDQEGKPVGLVYVGVAGADGVHTVELRLDGDRAAIREAAALAAVRAVLDTLGAARP